MSAWLALGAVAGVTWLGTRARSGSRVAAEEAGSTFAIRPRLGPYATVERASLAIFGRKLGVRQILGLAGVGGLPHVDRDGRPAAYRVDLSAVSEGLVVEVSGPWIDTYRQEVRRADDGRGFVVDNAGLILDDDTPTGTGRAILHHQVRAGQRAGARAIELVASRSDVNGLVGYYVWARLGFDGPLPWRTQQALAAARRAGTLPAKLVGARSVAALMRTPEGRAFWKRHGDTFDGVYPLAGRRAAATRTVSLPGASP